MKRGSSRNPAMKILAAFWMVLAVLAVLVSLLSLPPASQSKVRRLKLGMDTNEARAVLGKPSSVVTDTHGFQLWEYNRFSWETFMLHFDASGHLVSFETD